MDFEKLPDVQKPASIIFNVTYVGDKGDPLKSREGDTLKYMWLSFITDQKVELLNASEDSVWHGLIEIGESVNIEHLFQITDANNDACCKSSTTFWACHHISPVASFFKSQSTVAGFDSRRSSSISTATLYFNHLSKVYHIKDLFNLGR